MATGPHPCDIFRPLDGKVFKVKDMAVGENAPPMHSNCHCCTGLHWDGKAYNEWLDSGAAADGVSFEDFKKQSHIDFDKRISNEQKNVIEQLNNNLKSRFQKVQLGSKKSAGQVDITGATMKLSSKSSVDAIHEFAHTIANSTADKLGLTNDKDFWKEIKSIRRSYRKDVGNDTDRWISSYEHSNTKDPIDEFFAEAFTHAYAKKSGITLPDKYGSDFTYSNKVLNVVEKYKAKNVFKQEKSGAIFGAYTNDNDPDYTKREKAAKDFYREVANRKKKYEVAAISKNTGINEDDVGHAYDHIFIRKHLFEDGSVRKFDPDYYMANSWMRLREGKNIQDHDLIILKHEIEEEKIMSDNLEISYETAHNEANKKYNYAAALKKYLKEHDV